MATVSIKIVGKTPLLFGKKATSPIAENEGHDRYEERVWREKAHADEDGQLFIPAMAVKRMLESAAAYRSDKLAGRKTFTKLFEAGVVVVENAALNRTRDDIKKHEAFVPSDGKSGGGTRVLRFFPLVNIPWEATASVVILDGRITEEVLQRHLQTGGLFCGLGMWRAGKKGMYGRFVAQITNWERDDFDPPEAPQEAKPERKARESRAG